MNQKHFISSIDGLEDHECSDFDVWKGMVFDLVSQTKTVKKECVLLKNT